MMRYSLTAVLGLVVFFTLTSIAIAYNSERVLPPVSNDKELIIQIENLNVKNSAAIIKGLSQSEGVTYRGMCHTNNVLMFVVDRDVQPDNVFVDEVLAPFNLTWLLKDGATILQVQNQCSDYDTNDHSTE